ncbi:hypothetical protein HN51_045679 [Arachis hypogaea]
MPTAISGAVRESGSSIVHSCSASFHSSTHQLPLPSLSNHPTRYCLLGSPRRGFTVRAGGVQRGVRQNRARKLALSYPAKKGTLQWRCDNDMQCQRRTVGENQTPLVARTWAA